MAASSNLAGAFLNAGVAELADAHGLELCGRLVRRGSIPLTRTKLKI